VNLVAVGKAINDYGSKGEMMSDDKPRLSIGLPVFNGENYLGEALDSILAQTYIDFELIISDNASTDETEKICRAYAARDERIRYFRNETNLGAAKNFNRVFELSSGEYFKWAAHDDVLGPEFLSRCILVLDQDPSIVLCHTKAGRIDEHGALMGVYEGYQRIGSQKPYERFLDLIRLGHTPQIVFGVVRASALEMTSLIGPYPASDRVLLAQLGLIGRLYEIPEMLFYRRDHPQTTWQRWGDKPERVAWYDSTKTGRIVFPYWRLCFEYFMSINRIPLSWSDRLLCYVQMARLFKQSGRQNRPMWRWLVVDLEGAAKQIWFRSRLSRELAAMSRRSEEFS
jgi:glycosyltransferase involved in cell wall biosynthesis